MWQATRFVKITKTLLLATVYTLVSILLIGSPVQAQAIHEPADIQFKVINGTTGSSDTLDRLQIQYRSNILNPVLDVTQQGPEFTLYGVPITEVGQYIITAWKHGVPYFGQYRGSTLLTEVTTLHVFDVSPSCQDISINGLTMLLKKNGPVLNLEYMLKINNEAKPQITVLGKPTFELNLPTGYSQLSVHYMRGPDPITIAVTKIGDDLIGLTVPLTSGLNSISITATVPFTDGMELPIAGNLPVEAWSLMTSPNSLIVDSFELEQVADHGMEGWNRYVGPELDADRNLAVRLNISALDDQEQALFSKQEDDSTEPPSKEASGTESKDKDNFPWIPMGFVTILAIVIAVRRRRS